jgi:hypothetical protein
VPSLCIARSARQEALIAYCRAALRLGLLQELGPLAVDEVQQMVMNELTADDFSWCVAGSFFVLVDRGECSLLAA